MSFANRSETVVIDDWQISGRPCPAYLQWVRQRRTLFAAPEWSRALAALGADAKFAWSPSIGRGIQLACFARGPLRVGVLGFPVAGSDWDSQSPNDRTAAARTIARRAGLDMLRINSSAMTAIGSHLTTGRQEVWIDRLPEWDADSSRRLRKDLAFARRANPLLRLVESGVDPETCFRMYATTVDARGGRLRYSAGYFESLTRIAADSDCLRVFGACDANRRLRGFAVLAVHGSTGYYLHGGTDAEGKREGVSDLLLAALVDAARDLSCQSFSLMSSPWEQPGLMRYKSKWEDHIGLSITEDIGVGVLGRTGQLMSNWQTRKERRLAIAWSDQLQRGPP